MTLLPRWMLSLLLPVTTLSQVVLPGSHLLLHFRRIGNLSRALSRGAIHPFVFWMKFFPSFYELGHFSPIPLSFGFWCLNGRLPDGSPSFSDAATQFSECFIDFPLALQFLGYHLIRA